MVGVGRGRVVLWFGIPCCVVLWSVDCWVVVVDAEVFRVAFWLGSRTK